MVKRGEDSQGEDESPEMNVPDAFEEEEVEIEEGLVEEVDLLGGAEDTTDLVTVAQARNMKEARTMKSILESAEITAFVGREPGGADEADETVMQGIPVLVPAEMVGEAEEILAEAAMSNEKDDEELDDEEWDDDEEDEEDEYFDDSLEELEDEEDEDFEDLDEEVGEGP